MFLSTAYLSSGQAGPQAVGDSVAEGKAPYYIPGSLGKLETLELNSLWPSDVNDVRQQGASFRNNANKFLHIFMGELQHLGWALLIMTKWYDADIEIQASCLLWGWI